MSTPAGSDTTTDSSDDNSQGSAKAANPTTPHLFQIPSNHESHIQISMEYTPTHHEESSTSEVALEDRGSGPTQTRSLVVTARPSNGGETREMQAAAPISPAKPEAAPNPKPLTTMMPVAQLKPHDENAKIYGDKESVDDLCESIRRNNTGILEPLLITKDCRIISGHRRYRAASKLELKEVPVRTFDSNDEVEILNALLEQNRHRIKTKAQIAAEASLQMRIQTELGKRRKNHAPDTVEKIPLGKKGKARDAAGEMLGISGRSAEKAAKASNAIDKLRSQGKDAEAAKVEDALNKGFETGFNAAVEVGVIEKPKTKKAKSKNSGSDQSPTSPASQHSESTEEIPSDLSAYPPQSPSQPATPPQLDSDQALTFADRAVTFLRECEFLTPEQQWAWGKLIDQLNKLRKSLGF